MTQGKNSIAASELRLGNWVLHKGVPTTLSEIGNRGLRPPYMSVMCRIEDFEPIPITPAILEKVKGVQVYTDTDGGNWYTMRDGEDEEAYIEWTQGDMNGYCDIYITVNIKGEWAIIKRCRYLHDMINSWYYLTGKELEIEL